MSDKGTRGLAAIMFTDMVGYTAMMQEDENRAKKLRDRHRQVLRDSISHNNGKILQYYGDGTLIIFNSAIEAVNSGVEIQSELSQEPKIPLRIGIHSGDIVYDNEGIYGDGVNIASRIESLAVQGSILISEKIFDDVKNHKEISTKSLGEFEFKNVRKPIEVFSISNEGLVVPERSEVSGKTKKSLKSIAVLPFVNMSTDPENEYFSDGITEELLNALTKIEGLKVTSRTSSFMFKGKNEDIKKIAQQLNVKTILEGSVRKASDRVRITAQLISAADGFHIWSDVYDRKLEDIFEVQDEISLKIANALREKLSGEERKEHMVKSPTINFEAYNLYLKGLYHWNKWTPDNAKKAMGIFEDLTVKEPDFALPFSGLAKCYSFLGGVGYISSEVAGKKAYKYAKKAIELDSTNAEAYTAMAAVQFILKWDFEEAKRLFEKALKLNPGLVEIHQIYGMYLYVIGKPEEALVEAKKAYELDPLSVSVNADLGQTYFYVGKLDDAIKQHDKALELDPNFRIAIEAKGWVYTEMGEYDKALEEFERFRKMSGNKYAGIASIGHIYALKGEKEKALEYLEMLKEREKGDNVSLQVDFAILYAGLQDYDKVFYHLNKAVDERLGPVTFIKANPNWKKLSEDPRFGELLERIGFKD